MTVPRPRCDLLVLGCGPAGAASALIAATAGLSVVIVDRGGDQGKFGETLAARGLRYLERLGIAAPPFQPVYARRVAWGGDTFAESSSILGAFGNDVIVDRAVLNQLLRRRLTELCVEVFEGHVRALQYDSVRWSASIDDGASLRHISSDFVIDASGRAAWLSRRQVGAPLRYDRLVGRSRLLTTQGEEPVHRIEIASAPNGWWYRAPLTGETAVVSFFTDADLDVAGAWRVCPLARAHEGELRALTSGAATQIARRIAGDRWVAVGDAVMACDPLSSQGLLYAFESAFAAVEAVLRSDVLAYTAYQRSRIGEYFMARAKTYEREERFREERFWRRRRMARPAANEPLPPSRQG